MNAKRGLAAPFSHFSPVRSLALEVFVYSLARLYFRRVFFLRKNISDPLDKVAICKYNTNICCIAQDKQNRGGCTMPMITSRAEFTAPGELRHCAARRCRFLRGPRGLGYGRGGPYSCDYILVYYRKRPCPPGAGCTVWERAARI